MQRPRERKKRREKQPRVGREHCHTGAPAWCRGGSKVCFAALGRRRRRGGATGCPPPRRFVRCAAVGGRRWRLQRRWRQWRCRRGVGAERGGWRGGKGQAVSLSRCATHLPRGARDGCRRAAEFFRQGQGCASGGGGSSRLDGSGRRAAARGRVWGSRREGVVASDNSNHLPPTPHPLPPPQLTRLAEGHVERGRGANVQGRRWERGGRRGAGMTTRAPLSWQVCNSPWYPFPPEHLRTPPAPNHAPFPSLKFSNGGGLPHRRQDPTVHMSMRSALGEQTAREALRHASPRRPPQLLLSPDRPPPSRPLPTRATAAMLQPPAGMCRCRCY